MPAVGVIAQIGPHPEGQRTHRATDRASASSRSTALRAGGPLTKPAAAHVHQQAPQSGVQTAASAPRVLSKPEELNGAL